VQETKQDGVEKTLRLRLSSLSSSEEEGFITKVCCQCVGCGWCEFQNKPNLLLWQRTTALFGLRRLRFVVTVRQGLEKVGLLFFRRRHG
jgi:hypothetical protein